MENFKTYVQSLFPFMTEEEPLPNDKIKKIKRFQNRGNYVKAATKGARETETAAQKMVSAPISSFFAGKEEILNVYKHAYILPSYTFPNNTTRPEMSVAYVHLKSKEILPNNKHKYRLLAIYQGKEDTVDLQYGSIIAGLIHIGGYITHVWVDKEWRGRLPGSAKSLYEDLRTFARKYLGIHDVALDDELLSKSFLAAKAKYDYDKVFK